MSKFLEVSMLLGVNLTTRTSWTLRTLKVWPLNLNDGCRRSNVLRKWNMSSLLKSPTTGWFVCFSRNLQMTTSATVCTESNRRLFMVNFDRSKMEETIKRLEKRVLELEYDLDHPEQRRQRYDEELVRRVRALPRDIRRIVRRLTFQAMFKEYRWMNPRRWCSCPLPCWRRKRWNRSSFIVYCLNCWTRKKGHDRASCEISEHGLHYESIRSFPYNDTIEW